MDDPVRQLFEEVLGEVQGQGHSGGHGAGGNAAPGVAPPIEPGADGKCVIHDGDLTISQVKQHLDAEGIPVRI